MVMLMIGTEMVTQQVRNSSMVQIHSIDFRSQAQGNSWKKAHSSGVALAFILVTILGVPPLVYSPIHG